MTLGKKIGLGFGALILVAGAIGGLAVFNMKSVQTLANRLTAEYVPEAQVASDLRTAVTVAQLAIRSYGLTASASYLDAGRPPQGGAGGRSAGRSESGAGRGVQGPGPARF